MALPSLVLDFVSTNLKFQWKLAMEERILCSVDASLFRDNQYTPLTCILTNQSLVLVNEDEDAIQQVYTLINISLETSIDDPTLTILKIYQERSVVDSFQPTDRVAQFVLDSIQFAENPAREGELTPLKPEPQVEEEYMLFINPNLLAWFSASLRHAKDQLGITR